MSEPVVARLFSASTVRGGGCTPTMGLVAMIQGRSGAEWTAMLSLDQAGQLIDALAGALALIEEEAAQAAAATKQ